MKKNKYLKYRADKINNMCQSWNLKKINLLMAEHKIESTFLEKFKLSLKLYISRALEFENVNSDDLFIKLVDSKRNNRKNITPNGAVVPKKEYNLEYNLFIKSWCELIKYMTKKNPTLLKYFRMTPNVRIKFSKEYKDNIKRDLNTSHPHSDAWVEGPWGMNCYIPMLGDARNNTLVYYLPNNSFNDSFLNKAKTYKEMSWVLKYYNKIKFVPRKGCVYLSDYALIHNTHKNKKAGTRISIDSTVFTDKYHKPPVSRIKEYKKKIPLIGTELFLDSGQYAFKKFKEKKSLFSHYTSGSMKSIKLISN